MDGCGAQQDPRMLFGAKVPTEGGAGTRKCPQRPLKWPSVPRTHVRSLGPRSCYAGFRLSRRRSWVVSATITVERLIY